VGSQIWELTSHKVKSAASRQQEPVFPGKMGSLPLEEAAYLAECRVQQELRNRRNDCLQRGETAVQQGGDS